MPRTKREKPHEVFRRSLGGSAHPRYNNSAAASSASASSSSAAGNSSGGFLMDKSLGQHILKNPMIITSIVERAEIKPTDIVLEIGPGTGNLTMQLLERAKKVIAVEYDKRMVAELHKRAQAHPMGHHLEIIHGDFLKVDLPYFDVCVANCPYQISSPLTFKLLAHRPMFRSAILMFQQEFAMRMVARPGDKLFCRLSINTQLLAHTSHVMKVGRNCFKPPPKVESSVVRLDPRNPPPDVNFVEWDGLVRVAFGRKNKTLSGIFRQKSVVQMLEQNHRTFLSMQGGAAQPIEDMKHAVMELLDRLELGDKRASKLDVDDFLVLLEAFHSMGVHFAGS